MTCGEVAEALNCDGVPAPSRDRWIRGTILQIVGRRAYLGQLAWNKTISAEPLRRRKPARPGKSKRTSFKRRTEAEWIHINTPPLIDAETFHRAQQALSANRKYKSGRPSFTYLLTGLLQLRTLWRRGVRLLLAWIPVLQMLR